MAKTRHMQVRMSQRGIRQELITLTQRFGEPVQDKIVLSRKGIQTLLEELRELQRVAMRALDKGGVVVIESGETLITTYNLDSHDRRKAHAA